MISATDARSVCIRDVMCRYSYAKPTSWVITPRVREAAREHFGCSSLKGMALEDIPMSGGAGSHWEARSVSHCPLSRCPCPDALNEFAPSDLYAG